MYRVCIFRHFFRSSVSASLPPTSIEIPSQLWFSSRIVSWRFSTLFLEGWNTWYIPHLFPIILLSIILIYPVFYAPVWMVNCAVWSVLVPRSLSSRPLHRTYQEDYHNLRSLSALIFIVTVLLINIISILIIIINQPFVLCYRIWHTPRIFSSFFSTIV